MAVDDARREQPPFEMPDLSRLRSLIRCPDECDSTTENPDGFRPGEIRIEGADFGVSEQKVKHVRPRFDASLHGQFYSLTLVSKNWFQAHTAVRRCQERNAIVSFHGTD
ncbi:Uncharacterised protein [Mycobacteroides abscessus subsp. abscessus]|nr:Uncharacterised protein [Mycobacteroides abscessus subsp. abscessus]